MAYLIGAGDLSRLYEELDALRTENKALVAACQSALTHVQELRSAWQRGIISEHDGQHGTRSNRNIDVDVTLRAALAKFRSQDK